MHSHLCRWLLSDPANKYYKYTGIRVGPLLYLALSASRELTFKKDHGLLSI